MHSERVQWHFLLLNINLNFEISGPRSASRAAQSGQCEGVRTFSGIPRHLSFLWKHSGQTQTGKRLIWLKKK